jgi:membrane protein required for colicin V production
MNSYDIVMLGLLLASLVYGARKGLVWQVAALSSLVVSSVVAHRFSPQLAPVFGAQAPLNRLLAMLVLFLSCALAIWLLFGMVGRVVEQVRLRSFDRQMGALVGAVQGVFLCIVVTFFVVTMSESARSVVVASRSGQYIGTVLEWAHPFVPEDLHRVLHPYYEQLREHLDPGYAGGDDVPAGGGISRPVSHPATQPVDDSSPLEAPGPRHGP